MENLFKKLPKNARWNMIMADIISGLLIIGVVFVIKSVVLSFSLPDVVKQVTEGIFYLVITFSVLDAVLTQVIGYKRVKYLITAKSIETYKGIYYITHEIVPIRKMQQVDIEIGPINKLFNLATVKVITAGGSIELEYVDKSDAEEIASLLKDKINEFAKEVGNNEA